MLGVVAQFVNSAFKSAKFNLLLNSNESLRMRLRGYLQELSGTLIS